MRLGVGETGDLRVPDELLDELKAPRARRGSRSRDAERLGQRASEARAERPRRATLRSPSTSERVAARPRRRPRASTPSARGARDEGRRGSAVATRKRPGHLGEQLRGAVELTPRLRRPTPRATSASATPSPPPATSCTARDGAVAPRRTTARPRRRRTRPLARRRRRRPLGSVPAARARAERAQRDPPSGNGAIAGRAPDADEDDVVAVAPRPAGRPGHELVDHARGPRGPASGRCRRPPLSL